MTAGDQQATGGRPDLIDDVDDLIGACGAEAVFAALRLAELIHRDGMDAVSGAVTECLAAEGWETPPAEPGQPALNETEQKVWAAWNALPDDEPSPVKRIARTLAMEPADVAFIVYPAEQLGRWDDSQEPDLPDEETT